VKTPASAILCFVLASLLGAVGQFLYKAGATQATGSFASYALNPRILAGMVCYVSIMVLFLTAFKRGGEPSVLYPVYSSTFIFAALLAWWLYGVPIKPINVLGMACLVAGMYFMAR
jgi:uncharacterized membrane protein